MLAALVGATAAPAQEGFTYRDQTVTIYVASSPLARAYGASAALVQKVRSAYSGRPR